MLPDKSEELEIHRAKWHRLLIVIGIFVTMLVGLDIGISAYAIVTHNIMLGILSFVVALWLILGASWLCYHIIRSRGDAGWCVDALRDYQRFRHYYNNYITEPTERKAFRAYKKWKDSKYIPFTREQLRQKFANDGIPSFVSWQSGVRVDGIEESSSE